MQDESGAIPEQPLRDTLEQHHGCMQAVEKLEAALACPPEPAGPWLAGFLTRLRELGATLAEHFGEEQEGALYRELPLQRPEFAGAITRLAAEHPSMLERVAELEGRASSLRQPETYQLRELNGRAQLLVATIRRHEAEENEIIMTAFWSETGGRG